MSCLSDVEEGYYGGHSAQNSIPATAIVLRATIRLRDYSASIFNYPKLSDSLLACADYGIYLHPCHDFFFLPLVPLDFKRCCII